MKVFKAIKECTISYRDTDNRATDFCLNPGDFFFIKENAGWDRIQTGDSTWGDYRKFDMLTKIYYNELNIEKAMKENIMEYNFTWINDIDVIDPAINRKYGVSSWDEWEKEYSCKGLLEDVSLSWNRGEKLSKIL